MERRQDVREAMVGLSRAEVLACAGAPFLEAQDGRVQVMSYNNFMNAAPNSDMARCEVSITLRNGLVSKVLYRGGGLLQLPCERLVRDCRPG